MSSGQNQIVCKTIQKIYFTYQVEEVWIKPDPYEGESDLSCEEDVGIVNASTDPFTQAVNFTVQEVGTQSIKPEIDDGEYILPTDSSPTPTSRKRTPKKKRAGKASYKCDYCAKKFPSQYRLTRHIRMHTG